MNRTGMQKLINIITLWLLSMAAFCSCNNIEGHIPSLERNGGTVIVTGSVSDIDTKEPVEGVKIIFAAFEADSSSPVATQNVYTDSRGIFNLRAEDISSAVRCMITADHIDYQNVTKEIIINWNSISYDADNGIFYVNDCDFHLERK